MIGRNDYTTENKKKSMGRRRLVLYSQLLTSRHQLFHLLKKTSLSFGYEVLSVSDEHSAIEVIRENPADALFCDETFFSRDFPGKLECIVDLDKDIALYLISNKGVEKPLDPDKGIDGYLTLTLPSETCSLYLFNIFKYISLKRRFRTIPLKTDPEYIKLLLRRAAHAVNNTLAGMQGYSELAQMHPEDNKLIRDTLDVVLDSSQRIRNEIKNLRAFVGVENPQFDRVSIAQAIGESISLIRTSIKARRIDLLQIIEQDFVIDGDYNQLIQVFFNLLNEIILICIVDSRVEISVSCGEEKVFISIKGDDCDLDKETFESLQQVLSGEIPILEEGDIEGRLEGHEVLAICNRIVHNHGGYIEVNREGRKRLMFTVSLPVLMTSYEPSDIESALIKPVYYTIENLDMEILVVDDEEYVRNTIYYFFDSKGCRVTLAEDGEFGLNMAREKQFDLVFMDYLMPKMGRMEAARKIKESKKDVKIVFITGRESIDEEQLYKSGVYACIKKPFEMKELYAIAKKVALESGRISVR